MPLRVRARTLPDAHRDDALRVRGRSSGAGSVGRIQCTHQRAGGFGHRAPKRIRLDPCFRATFKRGFNFGEGGNIASNGRVVQALILLLAACQQARHELDQADVVADGLREELNTLSIRLQDVLVQERRKSAI
jgi:hypothetical protein